jgi:hypothetical protein
LPVSVGRQLKTWRVFSFLKFQIAIK